MQHLGRRSPAPQPHRAHKRFRQLALTGCAAVLVTAVAMPDDPATVAPDWCWQSSALAPANTLITALGPPSADAAEE